VNRRVEVVCAECGSIVDRANRQTYCSPKCRSRAVSRRRVREQTIVAAMTPAEIAEVLARVGIVEEVDA
jgi:endogenous inhibitor of DNA gyrase (YacG/DUF329 family)